MTLQSFFLNHLFTNILHECKEFWIKIIFYKKDYKIDLYLKLLFNLVCQGHIGNT